MTMVNPASPAGGASGDSPDEIVRRLRAHDPLTCEQFVRAHSGMALAVARRLLRNEADACEAVQDAFLSFFGSLDRFQHQAALTTWLHRIVVNAALMKRRSKGRRPECSIEELLPRYLEDGHRVDPRPAWPRSSTELLLDAEVRELVRQKIEELPEDYRNVLLLRDIEQLDTGQTAELLGDTPGAIKTRLHRARQALRALLEREPQFWTGT